MKCHYFLQLSCYFTIALTIISCSDSRVFKLDVPIKDRGAHARLVKAFNAEEITNKDSYVSHTVIIEDGGAFVKTASIYGARCKIDLLKNFTVTVVDFNSNSSFDNEDQIILAGNSEDSVLINHNPLKVIGKNPVYFKYKDETIKLDIDENLKSVRVTLDITVDYHDLIYPYTIPSVEVQDLTSEDLISLPDLVDEGRSTLIIRSSPSCKPCLQSFEKYISRMEQEPDSTLDINKVFFFPTTTDVSHIIKYTRMVKPKHNFRFVKGDLSEIEEVFGLIVLPDGVLFDENARFSKNHMTLSNF